MAAMSCRPSEAHKYRQGRFAFRLSPKAPGDVGSTVFQTPNLALHSHRFDPRSFFRKPFRLRILRMYIPPRDSMRPSWEKRLYASS